MNIECEVTRYRVVGDEVVETTTTEATTLIIGPLGGSWVSLGNCAASAPIEGLRGSAAEGRGWCAQAGTKPVRAERCSGAPRPCGPSCGCGPGDDVGGWGGRNYPRIYVTHEALERALEEAESCTTH